MSQRIHGMGYRILNCPINVSRNSLALYYLQTPDNLTVKKREKALSFLRNGKGGILKLRNYVLIELH